MKYNTWYAFPSELAIKLTPDEGLQYSDLEQALADAARGSHFIEQLEHFELIVIKNADLITLCQESKFGVAKPDHAIALTTAATYLKFLEEIREPISKGICPDMLTQEVFNENKSCWTSNPDSDVKRSLERTLKDIDSLISTVSLYLPNVVIFFENS